MGAGTKSLILEYDHLNGTYQPFDHWPDFQIFKKIKQKKINIWNSQKKKISATVVNNHFAEPEPEDDASMEFPVFDGSVDVTIQIVPSDEDFPTPMTVDDLIKESFNQKEVCWITDSLSSSAVNFKGTSHVFSAKIDGQLFLFLKFFAAQLTGVQIAVSCSV